MGMEKRWYFIKHNQPNQMQVNAVCYAPTKEYFIKWPRFLHFTHVYTLHIVIMRFVW